MDSVLGNALIKHKESLSVMYTYVPKAALLVLFGMW